MGQRGQIKIKGNIKDLDKLVQHLGDVKTNEFIDKCAKKSATRMLELVIPNTPVDYGLLKSSWEIDGVINGCATVENTQKYSSYVEYGHRQEVGRFVPALGKCLKVPFVRGKFFMTKAAEQLESEIPSFLDREVANMLNDLID